MYRTYHYRLYPTRRQRAALDAQLRSACTLYNAALEHRRWLWRGHKISVSYREQSAELRILRREGLLPPGTNYWSQQEVLRRLDRAFAAFFRRLGEGGAAGYPRFKAVSRFSTLSFSFSGNTGGIAIRDGRVRLQGVGCVKVKWHRELPRGATLRQARITRRRGGRDGSRFYLGIQLALPEVRTPPHRGTAVGLDLGVRNFARLSTGELIAGPRVARRDRAKTRRRSRALSRKQAGSARQRRAAATLARHRERERNRRLDHAHKVSRKLADRFALLAVEDLNLTGMLRSARGTSENPGTRVMAKRALSREIADQGWGQFLDLLAYKAEEAGGRMVKVDARGTSQTCAACGHKDRGNRSGTRFSCLACGHRCDADTNAGRVILMRARALTEWPGRGLQAPTDATVSVA